MFGRLMATTDHAALRQWASCAGAQPCLLEEQGNPLLVRLKLGAEPPRPEEQAAEWDRFLAEFDRQHIALLARVGSGWHRFVSLPAHPAEGLSDLPE